MSGGQLPHPLDLIMEKFDVLALGNFGSMLFNGVKSINQYGNTIVVHTVNIATSFEKLNAIKLGAETFFGKKVKDIEVSPCYSATNTEFVYSIILE